MKKILKFLFISIGLFPMLNIIFETIKSIFVSENIKWTLKLYCLTITIPLSISFIVFLWWILGIPAIDGYLMTFKNIWIGYYFNGSFLHIDAWRWQIVLLILSFFIATTRE